VVYFAYRIPGWIGELLSINVTMALFALPLAGLWASGLTQSVVLSGLIPIADATSYYIDALRILAGADVSSHSAMRPFFPGFLSVLLKMTQGNLLVSLAIVSAIAGLACYLVTRELQITHRAEASTLFLILLFLFFRAHSGTVMSESLAISVAALGLGLIWRGASKQKEWLALAGLTITALALNIRPGAMFVLPAILCWGCWFFRGSRRVSIRFLLLGTGLVLIPFTINAMAVRALAGPASAMFANFSWALYGLASGGHSWSYVFTVHPQLQLLQEPEQSRQIYYLTLQLVAHQPALLMRGLLFNWQMFFSNTWYNVFSFVSGENFLVSTIARYTLYLLSIAGLVSWLFNRNDQHKSLAAIMSLGVFLSVPFVPATDAYRIRLYAAAIPAIALLPAMGLAQLFEGVGHHYARQVNDLSQQQHLYFAFVSIVAAVILIGPLFVSGSYTPPVGIEVSCPTEQESISILFSEGTFVNIARERSKFLDWMPDYHQSAFHHSAHGLADNNLIRVMKEISPPSSLFYTLDYQSNQAALVIIPVELRPEPANFVTLCGRWDLGNGIDQYHVFHAETLSVTTGQ